ncbi:MAG: ROK family protein, partial [Muribaculaceae bacterium]|nr:ROK family protein [Muribaculaceae bacterium]
RGIVETSHSLLSATDDPSILRSLENLDARAIGKAADDADPIAIETFRFTGQLLGEACADFTAFSSPEAFVFFGGIAGSFKHFKDSLIDNFNKNLLWIYENQVEFMTSELPLADAALLGAAAVARNTLHS